MTVLDDFYESYLHYAVAQRLFEDTCRQLTECRGSPSERQALVDETLRLAMCVTDNVIDTESLIADTVEFVQSNGGNPELLEAISYITNNLREDRDRADNYSLFVTARRSGNTVRKPRKPRVANPFVYTDPGEDDARDDAFAADTEEEPEPEEKVIGEEPEEEVPPTEEETEPEEEPEPETPESEEETAEDDTEEAPAEETTEEPVPEEPPAEEHKPQKKRGILRR